MPTLDKILSIHGRLGEDDASAITFMLCGVLEALHRTGRVHGTLGPQDVRIDADGRVRIEAVDRWRTRRREPSPYVAPEARRRGPTTKADVFSVAALYTRMVTGHVPSGPQSAPSNFVARALGEANQRPDMAELRGAVRVESARERIGQLVIDDASSDGLDTPTEADDGHVEETMIQLVDLENVVGALGALPERLEEGFTPRKGGRRRSE